MHNRREFLTGKAAQQELQNAGQRLSDQVRHAVTPGRGATVMLSTTAMACDFDVIMNPDGPVSMRLWDDITNLDFLSMCLAVCAYGLLRSDFPSITFLPSFLSNKLLK